MRLTVTPCDTTCSSSCYEQPKRSLLRDCNLQVAVQARLPCRSTALCRRQQPSLQRRGATSSTGGAVSAADELPYHQGEALLPVHGDGNGAAVHAQLDVPQAQHTGDGVGVRVESIVKHFTTREGVYKAVDGVDVEVPANSLVALLGPSGSGKTTLLRMIAGLETPTSGAIYFDDEDMTRASVRDRNVGFVFQNYALFKHMTVAQNIAFGPRVRKLDIDIDKRVEELLELVELPGLGNRYPPQLSGGQRQRVAMARALACNPRLLLLDEPFGALDPLVRVNLRNGLREIVSRVGVTTIIVTHDQEEAFAIADRVVVFNKGRIEQMGRTAEVINHPASPFVMNFIGDVNAVPSNCQLVKRMGFQTELPGAMFRPDTDVMQMFAEPPGEGEGPTCPATITDKKHIGWIVKYYLECDDGVKLELHVLREDDDGMFGDIDTLQRVFLRVNSSDFMGYHPDDVDAQPLDLV